MDDLVSPDDFIFSVLSTAKDIYGEGAKYINKTRAIKLVCLMADELDFNGITRGWYKFGEYSFEVNSILGYYLPTRDHSLAGMDFPDFQLLTNFEIVSKVKDFKKYFVLAREDFARWIHYERAPAPFDKFYKCNDEFSAALMHIKSCSPQTFLEHPRDNIGNIITQYNMCIQHVPRERKRLFFDFTDILEELLIVAKVRKIKLNNLYTYVRLMQSLYDDEIYPCLTPFEQTIKGKNKDQELITFRIYMEKCRVSAKETLHSIDNMITNADLKPKLEEYDKDILEGTKNMTKEELAVLEDAFKVHTRPSLLQ